MRFLFVIALLACGIGGGLSCHYANEIRVIRLSDSWMEGVELWRNSKNAEILYASYVLDHGSVVIHMQESGSKRWDLWLSAPDRRGKELEIELQFGAGGADRWKVRPESSDQEHLIQLLEAATGDRHVIRPDAGQKAAAWVKNRERDDSLDAIRATAVLRPAAEES